MKPILPEGYKVKYEHQRVYKLALRPEPKGGLTIARVYDLEGNLITEAEAKVHPHDNFCKRVGRDVSLGRALKQLLKGTDQLQTTREREAWDRLRNGDHW